MQSLVERYSAAYRQFGIVGMLTQLSPDVEFKNYANSKRQPAPASITRPFWLRFCLPAARQGTRWN